MEGLVAFQKIVARYQRGESAFDLTLEKQVKIRETLEKAFTLSHFKDPYFLLFPEECLQQNLPFFNFQRCDSLEENAEA